MDDMSKRLREWGEPKGYSVCVYPGSSNATGDRVVPARDMMQMWSLLREAADALDALHDRLEMRHAYNGDGERIDVAPGSIPDGIECRDETIKLLQTRLGARWQTMESAPRDELILVWYDHDADPYFRADAQTHPTDYAVWAECTGDFLKGSGVAFAKWQNPVFEATDDYGGGVWLPAWWCAYENGDYERAVNPTYWHPLPTPPEDV